MLRDYMNGANGPFSTLSLTLNNITNVGCTFIVQECCMIGATGSYVEAMLMSNRGKTSKRDKKEMFYTSKNRRNICFSLKNLDDV